MLLKDTPDVILRKGFNSESQIRRLVDRCIWLIPPELLFEEPASKFRNDNTRLTTTIMPVEDQS